MFNVDWANLSTSISATRPWVKIAAASVLLVAGYAVYAWLLFPPTFGKVRIDSPQVYTRERLVNDRFREQAWLEGRLQDVDNQQNILAEVLQQARSAALQINAGEAKAAEGKPPEPGVSIQALKELMAAAQVDLVEFDDRFRKLQSYRETLRRELIENELDDRHDLGSNSLYLFKFGAAISPGPRTRSPLLIEMSMSPYKTPPAMGAPAGPTFKICENLFDFECGFLLDYLYGDGGSVGEQDPRAKIRLWRDVYRRWIEDFDFRRRTKRYAADEYLQSASLRKDMSEKVSPVIKTMEQAFEVATSVITKSLVQDAASPPFFINDCSFSEEVAPTGEDRKTLEDDIQKFMKSCIDNFDDALKRIKEDDLFANTIGNASDMNADNPLVKFYYRGDAKLAKLDQAFKYILGAAMGTISDSCALDLYVVSAPSGGTNAAYSIEPSVVQTLLECARPAFQDSLSSLDTAFDTGQSASTAARQNAPIEIQGPSASDKNSIERKTGSTYGVEPIGGYARISKTAVEPRSDDLQIWFLKKELVDKNPLIAGKYREFPSDCAPKLGRDVNPKYAGFYVGNILSLLGSEENWRQNIELGVFESDFASYFGQSFVDSLTCAILARSGENEIGEADGRKYVGISIPVGLFRFIKKLSEVQRSFSYSVSPRADFDLRSESIVSSNDFGLSGLFGGTSASAEAEDVSRVQRVRKRHRILGFGSQTDDDADGTVTGSGGDGSIETPANARDANFGWYVLPSEDSVSWLSSPMLQPSNESLSAVVSVPAWWPAVIINVEVKWLDPESMEVITADNGDGTEFQVDLPVRMEFIKNLLVDKLIGPPTLDFLRLNKVMVTACRPASLLIPGERLWRSTVVTLGAQKSTRIEVMPDMEGIIARFDRIVPDRAIFDKEEEGIAAPLTVWTSEGNRLASDIVTILVPQAVEQNLFDGKDPCETALATKTSSTETTVQK